MKADPMFPADYALEALADYCSLPSGTAAVGYWLEGRVYGTVYALWHSHVIDKASFCLLSEITEEWTAFAKRNWQ